MWNMGKKKWLASVVLLALMGTVAGCGGSSSSEKLELNVAMNAEPETYDLGKTTGTTAKQMMLGNVFELLVNFDENYKVHPELAEKVDVNANYTEYVYHLRKGVKFHNGEEMKADDVVASMNRWVGSSGLVRKVLGDSRFEKVDDYTVKISLNQPLMSLNELIAGIKPVAIIVPKSILDKADPKSGTIPEYIGTGPYKVAEIKPNSYVKLEKFDGYQPYGEKGKASGWSGYKEAKTPVVVFHFVPDSSTRVAGIQSGEYDLAVQLPFDNYEQFNTKEYQVLKESQGDIGLIYNKKEGISTNKVFRQAINAVLNRDDIMTAAYTSNEFYKLTPSFIADDKNHWYTTAGEDVYNIHNPERAKELLAQAGYNGEEFRLMVSNHYMEFYNAAIVIEKELKDIGVNVTLDVVDWSTYLTKAKNPDAYDAFITGFPNYVDPGMILYLSPTWNGWSDDETLQGMMNDMAHSTDPAAAEQIWAKAQAYCWEDYMPASKLGNRYVYNVASTKVHDMPFFEGPHMWNTVVDE
jgi:peptide/nickel transport system substrate-binding protein